MPEARSTAKSCADCMANHARAVPTPAASKRTARFGLIPACPCNTLLSVTRDTPQHVGRVGNAQAAVHQNVLAEDLPGVPDPWPPPA